MDTPITVSSASTGLNKSDFLQLNYSSGKNEESVISLDSASFERVPVSWDTKSKTFTRTESNTTLTNIQKVSNWIKSIDGEELRSDSIVVDLDRNSTLSESNKTNLMQPTKTDNGSDTKSVILFRCDFNKSVTAKTYYPPLNPFNRATPLINYFKSEKSGKTSSSSPGISSNKDEAVKSDSLKTANKKGILKHLLLKRPDSSKLINYTSQVDNKFSIENYSKRNDEKSEGGSDIYEVPLSPESRKKELCSYLQLMNPADKKERFILQNRRSTRVRNLAAMQEKKELERKIKQTVIETIVGSEKDTEKCATLKSFKELNMKVEKVKFGQEFCEERMSENESEKDCFCFPFPSKEITENINDFDDTMAKLVPRYKRICKLKNIKLNTTITIRKSSENRKKLVKSLARTKHKEVAAKSKKNSNFKSIMTSKDHKLKEILRNKYKKPVTMEQGNSLRSTEKFNIVALKKLANKKQKGKELKERNNLRKRDLRKRQQINKPKQEKTRKNSSSVSSRRNSKSKSISSEHEVVTTMGRTEDRIDLENFMDDLTDFYNLSDEHKKCLIESRILSTKPITRVSSTDSPQEEVSKSFNSLDTMSPLYGFNRSNVNDVKKICEAYKNTSLLKNYQAEVMQDILDTSEVKVEADLIEGVEYKTEPEKSSVEKLACSIIEDIDVEFTDDLVDHKYEIESIQEEVIQLPDDKEGITNGISLQEHDYAGFPHAGENDEEKEIDVVTVPKKNLPVTGYMQINPRKIEKMSKYELLPYNKSIEMKTLHRSLQYLKRKNHNGLTDYTFAREWDLDSSPKQKSNKQTHSISIDKKNGAILKAFYIDYNLIICQEYVVSFWMQTPLGNVLGSQDMWIPRGQTQRLVLNNKSIQKESMEMVIAMDTHVAYIELWTKEHKSDIREGPVADVFATVYFWKQRQNGIQKRVLQLENINGFADDVQYSVMKCAPKIIVSWHSANEDSITKRTFIHAYQLAADYQTVANIYDIEPVDHYVSSLHNIEDCDNLIMGCGENKITLWNVEYGYIVATVELSDIKSPLSTLWVKCDRGFLFALQQCVDRELRLIAINGINHSWKKLASYIPPEGFDRLRGVCIENGLLLSFYDQGILCWKAETGEPVEETNVETEIIPSGKYVILLEDNRILVKHAITHLMSVSVDDA